ncbi:MAG: hypothetical protein EOO06_17725 [Chitinophagaceae bacterium]|nr:MAG: hypothetical protein EOO06_17725 [Chitinophagaceae bacterium]
MNENSVNFGLIGGKINAQTLHHMIKNGYADNPQDTHNIDGYVIDKQLSGQRAQVYYHPDTKHLVINHRGTKGNQDVMTDIKMMLGYKNNKRFAHGKEITDKAIKKYDTDNITLSAHSLGSQIAQYANEKHKVHQVSLNPAILPSDLLRKQRSNEVIVRSELDPISALHTSRPFKSKKNTVDIKPAGLDLLNEHSSDILKRIDGETEF